VNNEMTARAINDMVFLRVHQSMPLHELVRILDQAAQTPEPSKEHKRMDDAWREAEKKEAYLKGYAEGKENGLSLIPNIEPNAAKQDDLMLLSCKICNELIGKAGAQREDYLTSELRAILASRPEPSESGQEEVDDCVTCKWGGYDICAMPFGQPCSCKPSEDNFSSWERKDRATKEDGR
jgi:hypothetical protein